MEVFSSFCLFFRKKTSKWHNPAMHKTSEVKKIWSFYNRPHNDTGSSSKVYEYSTNCPVFFSFFPCSNVRFINIDATATHKFPQNYYNKPTRIVFFSTLINDESVKSTLAASSIAPLSVFSRHINWNFPIYIHIVRIPNW